MEDDGAMDIDDMDIDLGTDENVAALEAEAMQIVSLYCLLWIAGPRGNPALMLQFPGISNIRDANFPHQ